MSNVDEQFKDILSTDPKAYFKGTDSENVELVGFGINQLKEE